MRSFLRPAAGTPFAEVAHPIGYARSLVLAADGKGQALAAWKHPTTSSRGDDSTASACTARSTASPPTAYPPRRTRPATRAATDPVGGTPVVPVRVSDRIRMRFGRGLAAHRRGIVRLRMSFAESVTGRVWITDAFGRTLAKRGSPPPRGVPARLRLRLPRWAVRKLRGGPIRGAGLAAPDEGRRHAGASARTRTRLRGCETRLTLTRAPRSGEASRMTPLSSTFAAALAAVALAVAGCGGDDDVDTEKLQQQGEELRQQGEDLQEQAEETADEIRSGKKDAEEAAKELQEEAKKLEEDAKDTASDAIDEVQDADIPDEAREQLEEAQKQLEESK